VIRKTSRSKSGRDFWPAVKQLGPDGQRIAEAGLEQETEAL
jgi:hypothetical protein